MTPQPRQGRVQEDTTPISSVVSLMCYCAHHDQCYGTAMNRTYHWVLCSCPCHQTTERAV